jgi:hypothetical protein
MTAVADFREKQHESGDRTQRRNDHLGQLRLSPFLGIGIARSRVLSPGAKTMWTQFLINGTVAPEDWNALTDDDRRRIWQAVRSTSRHDEFVRRDRQNAAGAPQLTSFC